MKRWIIVLLAVVLLVGCTATNAVKQEQTELVVFAAASLTETLTDIGEQYKSIAPNVDLVFNFDSSGTLKTQIEEGAVSDLFLSAAPKQMNALEESGLILSDTRMDLLENKVALVVPAGNPKGIASFDDLIRRLREDDVLLAIGNADVPVGQYTQKVFEFYGIEESAIVSKLTYGTNVKEVTSQVAEGAVDCGIIYATDAFSAGLTIIDTATKEMCGQVIYPAAVLKSTEHSDAAKSFLEYLKGEQAVKIFEGVGFTAITGK